jgi:hypothetical protein
MMGPWLLLVPNRFVDDGAVAVTCTQSLRLQVEIPSKLKALIEKLEGEHDDAD